MSDINGQASEEKKIKFSEKQEEIINNDICDLLVSAAAGSGKTAVLVERILRRLCREDNPGSIDRLLIVTFTKNAAAALREKIDKAISKKLEDKECPEKVKKYLREQKRKLPYAMIMTTDAFCGRMLKNYFYLADVDPNYRIGDRQECAMLLDDAMKTVLERQYDEAGDGNPEDNAFLKLVMSYGNVYGDESLTSTIRQILYKAESTKYPEDFIKGLEDNYQITNDEEFKNSSLIRKYYESLLKSFGGIAAEFRKLSVRAENLEAINSRFEPLRSLFSSDAGSIDTLSECDDPLQISNSLDNISFGRFPVIKADALGDLAPEKDRLKKDRDAVLDFYKKNLKPAAVFDREQFYEANKACLPYVKELIRLTLLVRDEYLSLKKSRNIMEFSDVTHKVLSLLLDKGEDGERMTACAEELCRSYDEVMIDEYQDSNDVQEAIMTAISGELTGTKKLFMVGDVKQSIYAFRMAKPALFTEKYERYSYEGDEKKIDLSQNFRSTMGVIDAVNSVFSRVMKKEYCSIEYDDAASLKSGKLYEKHPEIENLPSELIIVRADDANAEKRRKINVSALAGEIKRVMNSGIKILEDKKTRDIRYSDICVLTRNMSGIGNLIADTLKDNDVPADVKTGEGYFQTREIIHMISFLRILDNPYQDIDFAAVLRSFIGGINDEELAMMKIYDRKEGNKNSYYYDILQNYINDDKQENALKRKLADFNNVYQELRKEADQVPLRQLLSDIYKKTAYYEYAKALPAGRQRLANLDMLLYKAEDFEKTDMKGISLFLAYIDKLIKNNLDEGEADLSDNSDSVSIMTIHASKGLEYPVVFVINLDNEFSHKLSGNSAKGKRRIASAAVVHHEYGLAMKRYDDNTRLLKKTLQEEMIKRLAAIDQDAEEMRLFYVAMTRAKQKLIMISVNSDLYDPKKERLSRWMQLGKMRASVFELENISSYADMAAPVFLNAPEGGHLKYDIKQDSDYDIEVSEADDEPEFPDPEKLARIREYRSFVYPYDRCTLPVKYSVSELKHIAIDEYEKQWGDNVLYPEAKDEPADSAPTDSDNEEKSCGSPSQKGAPGLGGEEKHDSARDAGKKPVSNKVLSTGTQDENVFALRGSLTHELLRHAVTEDISTEKELMDFARSMVEKERMDERTLELVKFGETAAFFDTDLCRRMREAGKRNELFLEQPFVYGMPASKIRADAGSDERVLLQGVIDAFFIENGEIVVVDYKTDRVKKGSEGVKKLLGYYRIQLDCYGESLASITGLPVKEKLIYSLCLGETISV